MGGALFRDFQVAVKSRVGKCQEKSAKGYAVPAALVPKYAREVFSYGKWSQAEDREVCCLDMWKWVFLWVLFPVAC